MGVNESETRREEGEMKRKVNGEQERGRCQGRRNYFSRENKESIKQCMYSK